MYAAPRPAVDVMRHDADESGWMKPERKRHKATNKVMETIVGLSRIVSVVAGSILVLAGIYTLYPLSRSLADFPTTVLKLYLSLFGVFIVLIEGKMFLPEHHEVRSWFYDQFKFLSGARGKAMFYSFVGVTCLTLSGHHGIFLALGLAMLKFGLFNLVASFFDKKELRKHGLSRSNFQTVTVPPKPRHKYESKRHSSPSRAHKQKPLVHIEQNRELYTDCTQEQEPLVHYHRVPAPPYAAPPAFGQQDYVHPPLPVQEQSEDSYTPYEPMKMHSYIDPLRFMPG